MRLRLGLTALGMLALGGCMQEWRPEAPIAGPCVVSEEARMMFVGRTFHDVARDDIQRATNARIARVLRPGDAATMDYRVDRLNILVDDGGRIAGLKCG